MADPPTQHSSQQSARPRPHLVQGAGQINVLDEPLNLCGRVYPLPSDTSATEPMAAIPLSSGRLLDVEEGWVLPPHSHFKQMSRESHLQELAMHQGPLGPPLDRMYSGDAHFGYNGIAYHPGMNHPLYDPSGRGQDVCCESKWSIGSVLQPKHNTKKDKDRVVVCLCGTGQELH